MLTASQETDDFLYNFHDVDDSESCVNPRKGDDSMIRSLSEMKRGMKHRVMQECSHTPEVINRNKKSRLDDEVNSYSADEKSEANANQTESKDQQEHNQRISHRSPSSIASFSTFASIDAAPIDISLQDIDQMIANEMNELSVHEREKVYFDIHGVAEIPEETPRFLKERQVALQSELDSPRNKRGGKTGVQSGFANGPYICAGPDLPIEISSLRFL